MKTIDTNKEGSITFNSNFYIVIGNNGNHIGRNRVWDVCSEGYNIKIVAINKLRQYVAEDGDMKYGLKPGRVVSSEELAEMIDSNETVNFRNCYDIA
jgi:hypothetical protein